ncbi:MAG: hypothetical protein LBJ42_01355 [Holosporales bacterium]|nr:hypothetical protein [Holosporales bacterium]
MLHSKFSFLSGIYTWNAVFIVNQRILLKMGRALEKVSAINAKAAGEYRMSNALVSDLMTTGSNVIAYNEDASDSHNLYDNQTQLDGPVCQI